MAGSDNEVRMMMSVYPGAMTGFAALNAGMSSVLNVFNSMTRAFDYQFGLADAAITTTSVIITQLGVDAMHAFGEFEQGMKIVQMVSNQTGQDMEFLKQKATEFSVQYRMDIDQITEGLQTLGRAGLNSASEQTEVLQAGLNTAKLEGRDLNSILQELIQNTSLLGGNLKSNEFGEDSQYVNDLLVATSMTAPITTHDVSETLKYSGGIAAAAGATIRDKQGNIDEEGKAILEDYMGAIAAFAQKGVTGSIAGTALRAFLNKPATQDSSVKEALASIKLKPEYLWEEGEETMKPISEQIKLIQDQMDELGVSQMDRLQIWSKIVGGKMGQQMMKLDGDSIKQVTKDIQAADSASNLAAGSMKTFEANVKQASEQGAALQRSVGEKLVFFANPILELINKITDFLNQDGASWPLALGVLSFVGILATRIVQVFRLVKTELASILSWTKQGLMPHIGSKQGLIKLENGTWVSKGSQGTSAIDKATTLKDFDKQYSKINTATNALNVSAMKAAGVSEQNIALAGRLSNLSKQIPIAGTTMTEGALWGAAIKHKLLTPEEMSALQRAYAGGMNARPLGDLLGKGYIETIVPRIEALSRALNDLGISAQTAAAQSEASASQVRLAYRVPLNKDRLKTWQNLSSLGDDRRLRQAAAGAQAHANALGAEAISEEKVVSETKVAAEEVVNTTRAGAAMVVQEFQTMFSEISAFRWTGVGRQSPRNIVVGPYSRINYDTLFPITPTGFFGKIPDMKNIPLGSQQILSSNSQVLNPGFTPQYPYGVFSDLNKNIVNPIIPSSSAIGTSITHSIAAAVSRNQVFPDQQFNNLKKLNDESQHSIKSLTAQTNFNNLSRLNNQHDISALNMGKDISTLYKSDKPFAPPIGPYPYATNGVGSLEATKDSIRLKQDSIKSSENASKVNAEIYRQEYQRNQLVQEELMAERQRAETILGYTKVGAQDDASKKINATTALQKEIDKKQSEIDDLQRKTGGQGRPMPTGIWAPGLNEKQKGDLEKLHKKVDNSILKEDKLAKAGYPVNMRTPSSTEGHTHYINEQNKVLSTTSKNLEQSAQKVNTILSISRAEQQNQKIIGEKTLERQGWRRGKWSSGNTGYMIPPQARVQEMYGVVTKPTGTEYTPETAQQSGQRFGAAFAANFSERLNRNRAGSFFSFGNTMVNGTMRSATKGLSGLANKALNATDMIGGPFMVAIMAVTTAIQLWQKAFQDYCEDLKEAGDKLKDAYSERDTAEDSLEGNYREQNPNATDEEINEMVLGTYSTMTEDMANAVNNGTEEWFKKVNSKAEEMPTYEYDKEKDDGTMKEAKEEEQDKTIALEEAIKENTGALYQASSELSMAMSKYVRKAEDSWWGVEGWTGQVTDALGTFQDWVEHGGLEKLLNPIHALFETIKFLQEGGYDNRFTSDRAKFTDENEFLLTARQKDENYAGYTGMAGLMLQDFKDAKGDYMLGLQTMMGSDAITLNNVISQSGRTFLDQQAKFASSLTTANNLRLQTSMKQDSKTWKALGKELVKYERKSGTKAKPKSTKKIEGLIAKLNASMGNSFNETQILQATYLQVMEGMLETAKSVIVPIITANQQIAAKHLVTGQGIYGEGQKTSGSTAGTEGITSVIAGMVSQIAMAQAGEAAYNAILMQDPSKLEGGDLAAYQLAQESENASDFLKKSANASYNGASTSTDLVHKIIKEQWTLS